MSSIDVLDQYGTPDRPLSHVTWLRVGGPARMFFQIPDNDALGAVLAALPQDLPVFPLGAGSNLIVRDGGLNAAVIKLGRGFMGCDCADGIVTAGAALPDAMLARRAAEAGHDLTFLRTIPGTVGGALRMNAGCYGSYVSDVLVSAEVMHRDGQIEDLPAEALGLAYRSSDLPAQSIITRARFRVPLGDPVELKARMEDQLARRDATQPVKDRTAGSTFRNPSGHSSTGRADDSHDLKAWKLIQDAGMKGARIGGAQMSEKHANFLVNTGGASAADLENLGEAVRKRVYENSGIRLKWEIMRIGEP